MGGTILFVRNTTIGTLWCIPFIAFTNNGSLLAQTWGAGAQTIFGPSLSTSSIWYHIVQTWSSTNGLRLYINNVLIASDTSVVSFVAGSISKNALLATRPSTICATGSAGSQISYYGDLDEFRIYSRELTINDICALYNFQ